MSTKSILILQGGGALGAYECGVYQALAQQMADLALVAGTSIGAVNAGLIARHHAAPDRGADALKRFWTNVLAQPSVSFVPPVGIGQRWNAVWTSILLGNSHMFKPYPASPLPWVFRPPVAWLETHFYDPGPLEDTLAQPAVFGSWGPEASDPRLIVTAVDIARGRSVAFDSLHQRITAAHMVASGSLPPSFPAREIEGTAYWDGGLWSNTPLREALNALQQAGPMAERYRVYIVDVFLRHSSLPQTNGDVWQRMAEIMFADRTAYDAVVAGWVNRYLDLMGTLRQHLSELPPSLQDAIGQQEAALREQRRVYLDIMTIRRERIADEEGNRMSGASDFSPERIAALIEEGYRDAQHALRDHARETGGT